MALAHSPKIVTDGLVFYYDMENSQKSWKGKPTTNLITDPQFNNSGYWSTWSGRGTSSWSYATLDGKSVVYTDMSIQNTETHQLFRDITVPAVLNTYALSLDVLVASDCTASSVLMNAEYPFGNSFGTSSYNMSNKGTWQRLYAIRDNAYTGVTSNPQNRIRFYFGSNDTNKVGKIYFTNAQLELGSFATPFVNGTRSNTQALLDLTGQNTITANSLTYASDGTFNFNGSADYLNTSTTVNTKTVIAWIKLSSLAGGDYVVYGPQSNGSDNWLGVNANKVYLFATQSSDVNNFGISGTTTLGNTSYYQIAATIDTNTAKIYLNGEEENTTTQPFTIGTWSSIPNIGRRGGLAQRYFPGTIGLLSVYDRVLSQAEIKQNFNATRSRYGV